MARKPVFKTSLGKRLAQVREKLELDRAEFVDRLKCVSLAALANYERGDNVPDANVLAAYRSELGIDLRWLVTGEGDMFEDLSKAPKSITKNPIDQSIMTKLARLVEKTFKDKKVGLSAVNLAVETGNAYNDLQSMDNIDMTDGEDVDAALPMIKRRIEKRITDTVANPNQRKSSA